MRSCRRYANQNELGKKHGKIEKMRKFNAFFNQLMDIKISQLIY